MNQSKEVYRQIFNMVHTETHHLHTTYSSLKNALTPIYRLENLSVALTKESFNIYFASS